MNRRDIPQATTPQLVAGTYPQSTIPENQLRSSPAAAGYREAGEQPGANAEYPDALSRLLDLAQRQHGVHHVFALDITHAQPASYFVACTQTSHAPTLVIKLADAYARTENRLGKFDPHALLNLSGGCGLLLH